MNLIREAPSVKLIAGLLYPDLDWYEWAINSMIRSWGEPERISDTFPFDHTNYYDEISPNLLRCFISFRGLRPADLLSEWKKTSCKIESKSSENRRINIDPGYINGARLVLASTKDHAHRVYLGDGIFAEVTMRYRFKKWVPFDYTFPDFSAGTYDEFFTQVREDWLRDINKGGTPYARTIHN